MLVSCSHRRHARSARSRLPFRVAIGFPFLLALAGAASFSIISNLAPNSPDAPAIARGLSPDPVVAQAETFELAFASAELAAERSALLFDGPTSLGAFSQVATLAPVLESRFATMIAQAPAPAAPNVVVVATTARPAEIPLPIANPFRQQASAQVSDRDAQPATRKPARPIALATAKPTAEKGFLERLFGSSEPVREPVLAYAPTESGELRGWPGAAPPRVLDKGDRTAIYDISSKTVLMPNGERLEAHSGLGDLLDDPRSSRMKNRGVTPPNVYTLRMRESLFHGVPAIRLIPVHQSLMYGRDGILAHTYMLGPRGDSNGCVSVRDYDAFLRAFQRGEVTRLVVAESAAAAPALLASLR